VSAPIETDARDRTDHLRSPTECPVPPPELRRRVTGTERADWFEQSGRLTVELYAAALATAGKTFADFSDVLDFGCGCGRVLRCLPGVAPAARLHGSDIDGPAVEWVRENLAGVRAVVNGGLPPVPFPDGAFDLVLAYSVFTHLDAAYQDAWLGELRRVTRPGAVLLLTVSGERMWEQTMRESDHPRLDELRRMRPELDRDGFVFWTGEGWEQFFPDFYHTTFHLTHYVHAHWSRWFTVLGIHPGIAGLAQDIVVARRDD
jgi:SAM-dependent methyltransferase